jgi:cell wall-associated NlpC family hydrolase
MPGWCRLTGLTFRPHDVTFRNRLVAAAVLVFAAALPNQQLTAQAPATSSPSSIPASIAPTVTTPVSEFWSGSALAITPSAIVSTASGDSAFRLAPTAPKKPFAALSASMQSFRDSLVARARAQIGTRYKFGGTAPEGGFDCSGFVRFVAKAFDIALPRTAHQQAKMGVPVPKDLAAMKPGDLLTFGRGSKISHIGIYVGEGRFVHASTTKHEVIETSLVGTHSPLIKQWKGVRRMASGTSVKLRDSVLAMLDTLH